MTEERVTAAVQLRDAGNSTSAIARQLGVGASSVTRALTPLRPSHSVSRNAPMALSQTYSRRHDPMHSARLRSPLIGCGRPLSRMLKSRRVLVSVVPILPVLLASAL